MQYNTGQKALAEFVGVFTLVFVGVGSVIAVGGAGVIGAVDGAALVAIALAHGLAIATMVAAIGHVSGGHINPAVTIGAFVTGKIPLVEGVVYVVAQLAGGAAGAGVLRAALPRRFWDDLNLGTQAVDPALSAGEGVLIEAVLTFLLVFVIFGTAIDQKSAFGAVAALAIGFAVLMDHLMGVPFTGASMNPARTFGPALVSSTWTDHWVYWIGPVAGGIVAAVVYDLAVLRPRESTITEATGFTSS